MINNLRNIFTNIFAKNENSFLIFRISFYSLILYFYLYFMKYYSPLGVDWLDWHFYRLENSVKFLKINGYFSNFGFSVWSTIENCSLDKDCSKNNIYLSQFFFSKIFYILIYEFFDQSNFQFYGQLIDKFFIFLTGVLISEILVHINNKNLSKMQCFILGTMSFIFFIINPWTYKMIIASWPVIFFLSFFLLGFFLIYKQKKKIGLIIILFSGFFEYQSSAGVAVYFILLMLILILNKNYSLANLFFFEFKKKKFLLSNNSLLIIFLILPVVLLSIFQFYFLKNFTYIENTGSSLLTRIGISGNDIHNGGIIGALQFLAGNRITLCFENDFQNLLDNLTINKNSSFKISIYNCLLSHLSIFILSIISIIVLIYQLNKEFILRSIISPIIFLILSNSLILQQSSSVHLMGYSYLFSIVFSLGISIMFFNIWKSLKNSYFVIFLFPLFIGFVLICIRVSMLTGVNG